MSLRVGYLVLTSKYLGTLGATCGRLAAPTIHVQNTSTSTPCSVPTSPTLSLLQYEQVPSPCSGITDFVLLEIATTTTSIYLPGQNSPLLPQSFFRPFTYLDSWAPTRDVVITLSLVKLQFLKIPISRHHLVLFNLLVLFFFSFERHLSINSFQFIPSVYFRPQIPFSRAPSTSLICRPQP